MWVCPFTTTRTSNLKSHIKNIHFNVKHQCKECEYSSSSNQALLEHVQARHKGINYLCLVKGCNFKALKRCIWKDISSMFINKINIVVKRRAVILNTTEDNLKYHIRTVHLGIRYTCDECGIKLKSQSILINHIRECTSNSQKVQEVWIWV